MLGTRGGCWSRLLPLHGFAINNFGFSVASLREVRLPLSLLETGRSDYISKE